MPKKKAIRVQAVKGFVDQIDGVKYRVTEGQVLELPKGASWLDVGFVVPAKEQEVETATRQPTERAVTRTRKKPAKKKPVDKVMRTTQQ